MYMEIIKEYVKRKKEELKDKISHLSKRLKLVIIQVNDDPASNAYVKGKLKDTSEVGIDSELIKFNSISQNELLGIIDKLNNDENVTGIIVQLPLPKDIDPKIISLRIDPRKDVDGFHPLSKFLPATPRGIINYLEDNNFKFTGKNALVIGRSDIVGRPIANLLLNKDMNVTILHSKTNLNDMKSFIKNMDLVVVSIGKTHFIDERFIFKKDAVVIDVGISRDENNKLQGDVIETLDVYFKSPVPGGVGLLTRLALLLNLYDGGNNDEF